MGILFVGKARPVFHLWLRHTVFDAIAL
jgi:hypothetical protein